MEAYFAGHDLDRESAATADSREARCKQAQCARGQGLREALHARPFGVHRARVLRPPAAGAHPTSLRGHVHVPIVAASLAESGPPYVAPDSIAAGFGRYIPYTQAGAVASGAWRFFPVYGGVRAAIPAASLLGRPAGFGPRFAQLIAAAPARYGYILQGDTLVPLELGPGDRYMLARAGDVF